MKYEPIRRSCYDQDSYAVESQSPEPVHSSLLGQLLSQHGQPSFLTHDGLFIVLYASPRQSEGGPGVPYLLVAGAHIAREIAFSSDSATTSSRRVSITTVHFALIAEVLEM